MEVRRKKEGPRLPSRRLFFSEAKRFFWICKIISDIKTRPNTALVKMRSIFAQIPASDDFGAASTTDRKPAFDDSRARTGLSIIGDPSESSGNAGAAFTLIELLFVTAIIGSLMILVAPAFTSIKSSDDVTNAGYTIKGVLEHARNYAMANNTYVWIGFYEEDGLAPSATPTATPGTGRLVISIAASRDGTTLYNPNSNSNPDPIDPARLMQVAKLVKIENIHLPLFTVGSGTGDTFDRRPTLQFDPGGVGYNDSRFGEINLSGNESAPTTNSRFPFQYPVGSPAPAAQYAFRKTLQFNPRGECCINSTYKIRRVVEIGLQPTHGNIKDTNTRNVIAIQFSGIGGNFKIYRR
jgi:type II secretory pathway pseudopilin PulG